MSQYALDEECQNLSLCKATRNAKMQGPIGNVVAEAAAANILHRFGDESLNKGAEAGLKGYDCQFSCL